MKGQVFVHIQARMLPRQRFALPIGAAPQPPIGAKAAPQPKRAPVWAIPKWLYEHIRLVFKVLLGGFVFILTIPVQNVFSN